MQMMENMTIVEDFEIPAWINTFFPYIFLPILAFGNSKYNKTKVLTKQEKEQEEIKSQNRLFDKLSGE